MYERHRDVLRYGLGKSSRGGSQSACLGLRQMKEPQDFPGCDHGDADVGLRYGLSNVPAEKCRLRVLDPVHAAGPQGPAVGQ